jgi:hypothetical protein
MRTKQHYKEKNKKNKTETQSPTKQIAKEDMKEKLKKIEKLTQVTMSNTRPTYKGKITPYKKPK